MASVDSPPSLRTALPRYELVSTLRLRLRLSASQLVSFFSNGLVYGRKAGSYKRRRRFQNEPYALADMLTREGHWARSVLTRALFKANDGGRGSRSGRTNPERPGGLPPQGPPR